MAQSNARILLNAEPFGFGPSAAIAAIAPLLKSEGFLVSYIGQNHTLDLQKHVAYDKVYDISGTSAAKRIALLNEIAQEYDLFFTAMDFQLAGLAKEAGMKVGIYDALTWYWGSIEKEIKNSDVYIAQKFYGVEERVSINPELLKRTKFVAPIIARTTTPTNKKHVLLNLGGLQNPYWNFDDTVLYARLILQAVKASIAPQESLIVAASSAIAHKLEDSTIRAYSRQEMTKVLAESKYALMTPGLGNIYDAAAFNVPSLWLPPANDSQGRQVELLVQHDCCDERIDWGDITGAINYNAQQVEVLNNISTALHAMSNNDQAKTELTTILANKLNTIAACHGSKTAKLLDTFGDNGAVQICKIITQTLRSQAYASTK